MASDAILERKTKHTIFGQKTNSCSLAHCSLLLSLLGQNGLAGTHKRWTALNGKAAKRRAEGILRP